MTGEGGSGVPAAEEKTGPGRGAGSEGHWFSGQIVEMEERDIGKTSLLLLGFLCLSLTIGLHSLAQSGFGADFELQ